MIRKWSRGFCDDYQLYHSDHFDDDAADDDDNLKRAKNWMYSLELIDWTVLYFGWFYHRYRLPIRATPPEDS